MPNITARFVRGLLAWGLLCCVQPLGAQNTQPQLANPPAIQSAPTQPPTIATPRPIPSANQVAPFPARSALDTLLLKRGDLTLRNTALGEALFTVSDLWGVGIVFGNDLDGSVNGAFRDATLAEVLEALLLPNGYGFRKRGNNLVVMPLADLGDANDMLRIGRYDIPPAVHDVTASVKLMLSPQGKAEVVPAANLLVVRDFSDHLQRIEAFLVQVRKQAIAQTPPLPAPTRPAPANVPGTLQPPTSPPNGQLLPWGRKVEQAAYFSPQFVQVTAIEGALKSVLGAARVAIIEEENKILVVADTDTLALAQDVVRKLDVPRQQVRITAMIYDVNLEQLQRLGVNWTQGFKFGASQSLGSHFGGVPLPGTTFSAAEAAASTATAASAATSPMVGATRLLTLNRYFDLNAIIRCLSESNGARLLADPTVTVLDREQAQIKIVTEIPIQQLTQTEAGGSIGTTTFREAGVTLMVMPQIATDGTIQMQVTPTFSVLTGFNEGQPIIDSREATTKVRVASGETLVLGGLRQRTEIEKARGIPGIKDLKHVGCLFRDHDTTVRESELLVFLRPEICHVDITRPREAITREHINTTLERLPVPCDDVSMFPDCKDCFCPLHNPQPRITAMAPTQGEVVETEITPVRLPGTEESGPSSTSNVPKPAQRPWTAARRPTVAKPGFRSRR